MKNDESPEPTRKKIVEKWKKRAEVTIQTTWKPAIAAMLYILAGSLCILCGLLNVGGYMACEQYGVPRSTLWKGFLFIVIGVLAVVGGRYILKRKNWIWVIIFSIHSTLSVMYVTVDLYLNSSGSSYIYAGFGILVILAIVLTVLSKGEFE